MTLRVFLVEDSAVIRENFISALEELAPVNFVGFAENEAAAVEWLRVNPHACDLMVIDIFLARGSGFGVLRQSARHPGLCKVVMSNYATDDTRARCLALGADRVFDKSTEFEELIQYCIRLEAGDTRPAAL